MTPQDFITTYTGQKVDYDGMYGAQCFDLFQFYNRDVVGAPFVPGSYAYQIVDTYPRSFYTLTYNTPTNYPPPYSVVVWGQKYSQAGHVAICITADANTFTCLSQNDPAGSPTIQKKYDSYFGVVGWLTPKLSTNQPIPINPSMSDQDKKDLQSFHDLQNCKYAQGVWYQAKDVIAYIDNLNAELEKVRNEKGDLDKQVLNLQTQNTADLAHAQTDCQNQLTQQRNSLLVDCGTEKQALQAQIDQLKSDGNTKIQYIETPLKDRFAQKPLKVKVPAALELLLA